MKKQSLYENWMVSAGGKFPSHHVGHIPGCRVTTDSQGKPAKWEVQYQQHPDSPDVEQFSMDPGNALFLLSLLKSFQLDFDIDFPDDPRAR